MPARIEHIPIDWSRIDDRPNPGEEAPLLPWLEDRMAAHADLVRQRAVRGDPWFFQALSRWDVRNTWELMTEVAPDLVDGYYRGPGGIPGYRVGEEEAYYDRQLGWLGETRAALKAAATVPRSPDEQNLAMRRGLACRIMVRSVLAGEPGPAPAEETEQELNILRVAGAALGPDPSSPELREWCDDVRPWLGHRTDGAEEQRFAHTGGGQPVAQELADKLVFLTDALWPKVKAGFWAPRAAVSTSATGDGPACVQCGTIRSREEVDRRPRPPCPQCGAQNVSFSVAVRDTIGASTTLVEPTLIPAEQARDWCARWQQIEQAVTELAEPRRTQLSGPEIQRAAADLCAFYVGCCHLKDYLKGEVTGPALSKQQIEDAISETPALALLCDLANLDKHGNLTKVRSGAVPAVQRATGTGLTEGGWRLSLEVEHAGETLDGLTVAQQAVNEWRSALQGWGLI